MELRQPSETEAVIRGAILAESLKPGTGFYGHGMRITRCARYEVTGAADYQPDIWTLIEFEASASSRPPQTGLRHGGGALASVTGCLRKDRRRSAGALRLTERPGP
jgi:hypothetical protein